MQLPGDDVGSLMSPSVAGLKFAALIGNYTNAAALIMVGWVLYQTIGIELPAMREQTFVRTQAIIITMERMKDSMDETTKILREARETDREIVRFHMEHTKVLSELTREIRELRAKRSEGQ